MNLTSLMQGKLTYRLAYTLMGAGVYLMAVQAGDLLVPPVDYVLLVAALLKGEGFKTLAFGVLTFGLRRAMAKGGAEQPPLTDEEKQEQALRLQEMLGVVEKQLQKMKGQTQ